MAVDAKRYLRLKPSGVVDIVKGEDGLSLRFKRFEPETGQELNVPELQPFVVEDLYKKRNELQRELDGVNLIIEECGKL